MSRETSALMRKRKPLRTRLLLCTCFLALLALIAYTHAVACYGEKETPLLDLRVGADRITMFIEEDSLKIVVSGYCCEEVGVVSRGVFHRITPVTSNNERVYLVGLSSIAPSDYLVIRAGSTANITINLYNMVFTMIAEKKWFEAGAASVPTYSGNISMATVSPATLCRDRGLSTLRSTTVTSVTATTMKEVTEESKAGCSTMVISETGGSGEKAMSYEKGFEIHEKSSPRIISNNNIIPLVIGAIIGLITYMIIVRFV